MKTKFKKILKNTVYIFMYLCNKIFFSNKKIVFSSFAGKQYSDNPKYISEYLENNKFKSKIVWAFRVPKKKKNFISKSVKSIKINSIAFYYHLATAMVWVTNFEIPYFVYKNKRQLYIQTWHGDRSLKKIMYDVTPFERSLKHLIEEKFCDYFLTGSLFGENMYKTAFRYNGEYLKFGCPRNDILFFDDHNKKNIIKEKLNIKQDEKILLFAPTFRNSDLLSGSPQTINIEIFIRLQTILNTTTKQNWKILLRTHVLNDAGFNNKIFSENIINANNFEDMAELLYIADFLITDYSSSATDFILTSKPVVLFQEDFMDYNKKDREFYYDMNATNFLIAYNEKELYDKVKLALMENSEVRNKKIREFYKVYETGSASSQVGDFIISQINKKKS